MDIKATNRQIDFLKYKYISAQEQLTNLKKTLIIRKWEYIPFAGAIAYIVRVENLRKSFDKGLVRDETMRVFVITYFATLFGILAIPMLLVTYLFKIIYMQAVARIETAMKETKIEHVNK